MHPLLYRNAPLPAPCLQTLPITPLSEKLLYITDWFINLSFEVHQFFWAYKAFNDSQVAPVVKNSSASAADIRHSGSIPELGRSLGGEHGNPLQYSCLENPMDREAWWATVSGVAKSGHSWTTQHTALTHTLHPLLVSHECHLASPAMTQSSWREELHFFFLLCLPCGLTQNSVHCENAMQMTASLQIKLKSSSFTLRISFLWPL